MFLPKTYSILYKNIDSVLFTNIDNVLTKRAEGSNDNIYIILLSEVQHSIHSRLSFTSVICPHHPTQSTIQFYMILYVIIFMSLVTVNNDFL